MSNTLKNIGIIIKNNRLKQKISYKRIYNDLRLPIKYFQDIENGSLDEKLNLTLTLRYLKSYVKYLNMNSSIITEYKEQYKNSIENARSHIIRHKKNILPKISAISSAIILLFLTLLVISSLEPQNNKKLLDNLSTEMKLLLPPKG